MEDYELDLYPLQRMLAEAAIGRLANITDRADLDAELDRLDEVFGFNIRRTPALYQVDCDGSSCAYPREYGRHAHLAQYGGLPLGVLRVTDGMWDWDGITPITPILDEEAEL